MNSPKFKGLNIIIPLLAVVVTCGMGSISATSEIVDSSIKTQTKNSNVDLNNITSNSINGKSSTSTPLPYMANPRVIKVDPYNNKVKVALDQEIKVTFTENIHSSMFNKILLSNKEGLIVPVTKSISGKVLTIKKKAGTFKPANKFTLSILYPSLGDKSGKYISSTFKSSFTTLGISYIRVNSLIIPSKTKIGIKFVIQSTIIHQGSANSKSNSIKFYLTPTKNSKAIKYYVGQRVITKESAFKPSTKNTAGYISKKVPVGSYYLMARTGKTLKAYSLKKIKVTISDPYPEGWVSANNITYYSQPNGYSCGPSSLKMVFSNYGLNISESWIERMAGSSAYGGTSHAGLIKAVARVNQTYKTQFSAWDESFSSIKWTGLYNRYISKNMPVILHVHSWFNANGGHYVVLAGLDMNKKMVSLADPSYGGYRLVSFSEMEDRMQWVVNTGRSNKPIIAIVNN